jgi:hypothetical protein
LLGEDSLAFLRIAAQGRNLILEKIINGYMFLPSGQTQESWKGMAVASGPIHRHGFAMRELGLEQSGAFLEVDWYSAIAGKIGVN